MKIGYLFFVCLILFQFVASSNDYHRMVASTLKNKNEVLQKDLHSIKISNVRAVTSKREVDFVTLSLQSFDVWTTGAKIHEPLPYGGYKLTEAPRYKSYKGTVDGKNGSIAALYVEQNEARGLVEMDGKHFNVRSDDQEGISLEEMDSEMGFIPSMSECAVPPPEEHEEVRRNIESSKRNAGPNPNIVRMAVDCHESVYNRYNGNVTAVASYFAGVFTVINSIYRPELLAIVQMSALVCGPTPHYDISIADTDALNQVRDHWQSNHTDIVRDTTHLMVSENFGGVAYVSAICNSYAYGLNGLTFNTHVDIWDYVLIAHELGHNLGSVHTHCYNPPIDNCYSLQSGCYSGPTSVPATGGSIMSYCYFSAGGLNNIQLSMGAVDSYGVESERVLSTIRDFINIRQSPNCLPICEPNTCAEEDCGTIVDGCGGTIDCGYCNFGTCIDNLCQCNSTTCVDQEKECGSIPDNCGGTIDCGTCIFGTCIDNMCDCTPTTCESQGKECGSIPNGCGENLQCGSCNFGTCIDNMCDCSPTTCESEGMECGTIPDNCGGTIDCGTCSYGTCVSNMCDCNPTTCQSEGKECGTIPDNCGGTTDCGTCTFGNCTSSNVCNCTPTTCESQGKECGLAEDFCGGLLNCGSCASNRTCSNNLCVFTQNANQLTEDNDDSTLPLMAIIVGMGALLLISMVVIILLVIRRRK